MNLLDEVVKVKTDGLFLVVLGASGSGKSHFLGTYPGKTLLLYGAGESHGPASALKSAKDNLLPVPWDKDKDGNELAADKIMPKINSLLDPDVLKKAGVKCVALDSLTALCLDIKRTQAFKQRCSDAKGNHNAFKETEALIEILSHIIKKCHFLNERHGVDIVTTIDLQIQSVGSNGEILESKPGLPTFGVGKGLIQQFPDILVLNRRSGNDPSFETLASVASSSQDRETKEIVKYIEFHPRLRGADNLPELIEANIPAIMKLKKVN